MLEPKFIFVARQIGFRNNDKLIRSLDGRLWGSRNAPTLVYMGDGNGCFNSACPFDELLEKPTRDTIAAADRLCASVSSSDVCCFQFTSGTTGPRKVSMLSHR